MQNLCWLNTSCKKKNQKNLSTFGHNWDAHANACQLADQSVMDSYADSIKGCCPLPLPQKHRSHPTPCQNYHKALITHPALNITHPVTILYTVKTPWSKSSTMPMQSFKDDKNYVTLSLCSLMFSSSHSTMRKATPKAVLDKKIY